MPGDRCGSVNPTWSKVKTGRDPRVSLARTFEGGPPEFAGRPPEAVGDGSPRWMVVDRGVVRRAGTEPGLQASSSAPPLLACETGVEECSSPQIVRKPFGSTPATATPRVERTVGQVRHDRVLSEGCSTGGVSPEPLTSAGLCSCAGAPVPAGELALLGAPASSAARAPSGRLRFSGRFWPSARWSESRSQSPDDRPVDVARVLDLYADRLTLPIDGRLPAELHGAVVVGEGKEPGVAT